MKRIAILIAAAGILAACDSGSNSNQLAASAAIAPGSAKTNGTRVSEIALPPLPGSPVAVASNTVPPNGSLQSSYNATPPNDGTATSGDDGAPTDGTVQQAPSTPPDTASYTPVPTGTNYASEAADFGIAPQATLKSNVGSNTPTSIPGGRTITTAGLAKAIHDGLPMMLIDAWDDQQGGTHATLPGATEVAFAGQAGTFSDSIQTRLEAELQRLTKGDRTQTLVFFCQGAVCWEAYNAALRAMHAGYDDVVWYRGGLPAWTQSGGQLKVPNQG